MAKPMIHARAGDIQIRPNLETEKVEFTYLPTGSTILLTVEQADALAIQLIAAMRGDGPSEIHIDGGFFQ